MYNMYIYIYIYLHTATYMTHIRHQFCRDSTGNGWASLPTSLPVTIRGC